MTQQSESRHQRLRNLVRQMNRQRKQQAKQIDILCNDLIDAQRDFIRRLGSISFAASFYKEILGKSELEDIYHVAGQFVHEVLPATEIVFCRPGYESWHHIHENEPNQVDESTYLEQYFNETVLAEICQANQPCDTDDMLALGLQVNPCMLTDLKAMAIPISDNTRCHGFILIYRTGQGFIRTDLEQIEIVAGGLARVICTSASCSPNSDGLDSCATEP